MDLPEGFTPFEKINIGSNALVHGKVLIALDQTPILLIGKGDGPRIWLSVPQKEKGLRHLIQDNEPCLPLVEVLPKSDAISVYYLGKTLIMQVVKKSDDEVSVTHLDLSALGLAIKADLDALTVGTNRLSGNIFEGVQTMVNVA